MNTKTQSFTWGLLEGVYQGRRPMPSWMVGLEFIRHPTMGMPRGLSAERRQKILTTVPKSQSHDLWQRFTIHTYCGQEIIMQRNRSGGYLGTPKRMRKVPRTVYDYVEA